MTDLNPCPSCREPLDHPSGDGCANMTAHKERAVGNDHLVWQLRNSKGWPTLGKAAADRIELLEYMNNTILGAVEQRDATIEALTEQLTAARRDAKEAEAYAEELEKELNTCRMAQAVMDNTVADLEAKLAKAVEAAEQLASDAVPCVCNYCLEARATLAEIKGESQNGQ